MILEAKVLILWCPYPSECVNFVIFNFQFTKQQMFGRIVSELHFKLEDLSLNSRVNIIRIGGF